MRAFTLIELLVSIAIIALLIAITLPQLAGARRAALDVRCKSQVRSVGLGLLMYRNDYGKWFDNPPAAGIEHDIFASIRNVRQKLDSYVSGLQDPEVGVRTLPWVCPLDLRQYMKVGTSHAYQGGAWYSTIHDRPTMSMPAPNYDLDPLKTLLEELEVHPDTFSANDFLACGAIRPRLRGEASR